MTTFDNLVDKSLTDWLLEVGNPPVRYFALRDLFDKPETDPEVKAAKNAILKFRLLEKIFSKQRQGGNWEESTKPYQPKYKSTYWQVMILAQLGIDRGNNNARRACEFVLRLQQKEGGFSSYTKERALQEYEWMRTRTHLKEKLQPEPEAWAQSLVTEHQYSCLTGNVCSAMIRMGYGHDSRVKKAVDWLVRIQNADGGWLCPYWKAHVRDIHSCFYGTICPLEAFSEIPEADRSSEIKKSIEKGAEFLLMHHLYKADHHGYKVIHRQWVKFSFPWFYGYHVLRGLVVLTKLGYVNDDRLADALELMLQKRCADGRWLLDSAPVGRMHANIEAVGKPSKWITLNALRVLKRLSATSNKEIIEILENEQVSEK